jgi:hypothetical protein
MILESNWNPSHFNGVDTDLRFWQPGRRSSTARVVVNLMGR